MQTLSKYIMVLFAVTISCNTLYNQNERIEKMYRHLFNSVKSEDISKRKSAYDELGKYADKYYESNDYIPIIEASIPYVISGLYEDKAMKDISKGLLEKYMSVPCSASSQVHTEYYETNNYEVKYTIIELLGLNYDYGRTNIYPSEALSYIASNDKSDSLRIRAIEIIGKYEIEPEYCVNVLIGIANDESENVGVRLASINVLKLYKDNVEMIIEAMKHLIRSEIEEISRAANHTKESIESREYKCI